MLAGVVGSCDVPPDWRDAKVFAHAPCEIRIAPDCGERWRINFGVFEEAWLAGETNGVRFEVRGLVAGDWTTLATRDLDPLMEPADREGGTFVLDIPPGTQAISLTTDPLGNSQWDWSCWGPIYRSGLLSH